MQYLEEYIDGQEVELLLDCIRVTAGPLHALAGAIRPARMPVAPPSVASVSSLATAGPSKTSMVGHVVSPSNASIISSISQGRILPSSLQPTNNVATGSSHIQSPQNGAVVSGPGRGTGLVPSSLLPTDVSVVLRSPFWIRIIYRRQFAVDMRCFAGDQVWLQPAPPPRGFGSGIKGSLPCPQFRPFVMEQITTGYGSVDSTSISGAVSGQSGHAGSSGMMGSVSQILAQGSNRANAGLPNATRAVLTSTSQPSPTVLRVGAPQSLASNSVASARIIPGMSIGFHPSHRELNTAGYGFSDDGGYGGVWVPLGLGCLKKVLRGTLRYLGVVWLFAQFPNIIKEVLATHLKENEGALLHHDPDTPSLRFYIQ
jgi:mediator of RNA polymerase II transcription subunit 14